MKYLRSVRVDENDARDSEMLRRRGFLDPTGPKAMGKAVNIQRKLGNTAQAEKLKKQGRTAKEALRTPLAPAKTARQRYTLAELQPKKESFIPLTLPNLMEVDLTPNKPVGPMTRVALKNRAAGTLSKEGAKSLENAKRSSAMAASQRGSKFPGKRVRTNPKARLKPSTGGIAPMDKTQGEGEGSTLAKQRQVGARQ